MKPMPRFLCSWLAMALLCGALGACAGPGAVVRDLDASTRNQPERLVVVAVRNTPLQATVAAGSTPRAYTGSARYGVSSAARRDLRAISHDYGMTQLAEWPIAVLSMQCAVFQLPAGRDPASELARLAADPRVLLAQPMNQFATRSSHAADPYVELQHSLHAMDVLSAQRQSLGKGISVAVIDTGVDHEHPDLRGRVATRLNFVDSDAAQFQRDRHGTIVAGTIAANHSNRQGIAGVAPEAQLLALKACWQLAQDRDAAACNSYTLAQALAKAIELHAAIINLSLTGPADPLLTALAEKAIAAGALIVGAAGAAGDAGFPGNVTGMVSVVSDARASVQGATLRAPGQEVLSLVPPAGYDFASGDSVAVANVSGVAALLMACPSRPDATRVRQVLYQSSVGRMLNACHAVTALTGRGQCLEQAALRQ